MDEDEQNRYVAQLKEEFDSCDTTGTGFLDKEELTALCNKLHLEAHLSLLLDTLLGPHHYARVNFQEFKDGFVAVLSRSLDFSTSDEESSYLEPVVPEEVKPKFVKGAKRYGRRSRPDRPDAELMVDSEDSLPFETEQKESSPAGFRRTKLRRATSLESVESLKSDEEPGVHKEPIQQSFEAQGQQKRWKRDSSDSLLLSPQLQAKVMDGRMKEVWEELEVGGSGFLDRHELSTVCDHLGLHHLNSEELDALFRKLDTDLDGRVSLRDLQKGFLREGAVPDPTSSSTPIRPNTQRTLLQAFEEHTVRSTSPSLLSPTVGQRLLSRLDDGTGCTSPERVIALWTEEGIRNSGDILQTLDFPLEDRVSLAELTLALDNELLVSGNGIHQATLISYKNEIQHLQMVADQACKERDKVKADLEWADRRNLQLVSEVDDRQATMESLNETKIKGIEQEFRDRLTALRSQSEQESEVLLQQVERDRAKLREEVDLLRAQEASLQEEASNAIQESRRLEEETTLLKLKLSEAESTVSRLQKDLDQLLLDKFGSLDPNSAGLLNQEEHFSQIVKDYELQCRELRDRNDELNSELEMLKSQGLGKRSRRTRDHRSTVSWSSQQSLTSESDSDDPEMRRSTSPLTRKKLQVLDKNGLGSLESMSGPIVSIETELAMQQLKEKHSQEVQDLKIDLETKVNFYERSLELMRQNMEVERKDISQSFKVEICELEEQKALAEEKARKVRESLDKLQSQLQGSGGGPAWGPEQERRARREQAELDQNYAREISNLVQRLTSEKDQLEAQLKLKMDQEVLLVREEAERQLLQMKQQHGEAQRSLVHQFHCEHQRQKDQHVAVETRLTQLEQERQREKIRNAEKSGEEQARIYGQFSKEKLRMEEAHRQEVLKHQEHIANLEGQLELALNPDESRLENGNFEAKLVHCKKQCEQLEVELKESNAQCKQLKDKFQVVCAQLKESITYLESHEVLNKRLISDKNVLEEELALAKEREQQLLSQRTPLQQELDGLEGQVTSQRQGKEMAENNCSRMSALSDQLQAQLLAKEQIVEALREALERSQEVVNAKVEYSCKQLAELESLRMDRAKLIEDLKEQAMAVDSLQLNIDGVSEELERLKMAEKKVREALVLEQSKVRKTQSDLDLEREETYCLSREKAQYVRMADQLSSQITEMETETDMFRDQIHNLRSQLHENTVLMSDLRTQLQTKATEMDCLQTEIKEKTCSSQKAEALNKRYLNEIKNTANQLDAKDKEICTLKEQADNHFNQLQQVILESQVQLQKVVESTEWEKSRAAEQLMEMEKLVIALETVMDPASPHRSKLDAVNVENSALKDRLVALQQDIQCLEEDIIKKKQKLDEVEREHGKSREEMERIHKENSQYREEVLELSARNLELSGENAELNSRLRADQGAAQMLTEHLEQVSQEQEEGAAMIRRLQETTNQHEVERLRLQAGWQHDKELLERELSTSRKKLQRLSEVESELKSLTLKQQWLEQDKERLLQEAEERTQKIENLQESTGSLDSQVKVLRYQLQASSQENTGQAQEVVNQQGMLQEAQDKVEELKASVDRLNREKELLGLAQKQHEEKATGALQEECQDLRQQNQDLLHKLSQLQSQGDENERLFQECLSLRSKHTEFETAAMEAQDQALRANTALTLTQAQHTRGLQQLRDQAGTVSREQLVHLQAQLAEEQLKGQQLEESLSKLVQQTSTQMSLQQEQYEKVIEDMQEKMEEIELKLKSVRMMLQEKVKQLKEQLAKNVKSDLLLKDLYVENSQLMKALQVTEQRQKNAEKTNFLLEDKITALNKLLRKIAPASLTA